MSITELLAENGIEFKLPGQHHHVSHGWVGVDCPYCSANEGRFLMAWKQAAKYFNCWRCGPQRTAETLALLLGIDEKEATKVARSLRAFNDDKHPILAPQARRGKLVEPPGVGPLLSVHKRYLKKRGFEPETVRAVWGVRGISILGGKLAWRLYIPIHSKEGEIVSWTTRSIGVNPKLRYVTAKADQEKVSSKSLLYGEAQVPGHAIVICEGPTDVWAIGPGAVGLTGMHASMQQLYKMAQYPVRVVCLDAEPGAQERADKLCEQLAPFGGETFRVKLESAKDASECLLSEAGREELDDLRSRFLMSEV